MVLLTFLVLVAGLLTVLYRYLRARPNGRSLWRSTMAIGGTVGVARAVLGLLGWYTVEHTGGPLQIPGYFLSMLTLPEAALLASRRVGAAPPAFYVQLSLLLLAGSLMMVGVVALIARNK